MTYTIIAACYDDGGDLRYMRDIRVTMEDDDGHRTDCWYIAGIGAPPEAIVFAEEGDAAIFEGLTPEQQEIWAAEKAANGPAQAVKEWMEARQAEKDLAEARQVEKDRMEARQAEKDLADLRQVEKAANGSAQVVKDWMEARQAEKDLAEARQVEKDLAEARQAEKDLAEARRAADVVRYWEHARLSCLMAAEYFPELTWTPAIGYGWQSCALAKLPDGSTKRAEQFGDGIRHREVPDMDLKNYEVGNPA